MGIFEQSERLREIGIGCETCVDGEQSSRYYTPGEWDGPPPEKPPEACETCDFPYKNWKPKEHLKLRCTNPKCEEVFCLTCDVEPALRFTIVRAPLLCPVCLHKT